MSSERSEQPTGNYSILAETAESSLAEPAPQSTPSEPAPRAPSVPVRPSGTAIWLAALLLLAVGGVALSPFWAPRLASILPWGEKRTAGDYDALAERIAALEGRPAPRPIDVDAVKSAQGVLSQRIAALEAGVDAIRRRADEAASKTELSRLTQRLDTIAAQSTASAAAGAAAFQKMQQELARRDAAGTDLADRFAALAHQVQAQSNIDRAGSVLLLALLQIREAVEEARPFPSEYAAFRQLAASDAGLAAASEPLSDAARDGVASRSVLRQRLTDLGAQVAAAKQTAATPKWWEQALDRLRALVTIRRIDAAPKSGPEATVEAAQSALAREDLAGAVAALDKLSGASAAAAQPWLRMARQRLAVETALTRLQELLATRIGAAAQPVPASPSAAASNLPSESHATSKAP